jgi:hypothetical protein
MATVLLSFGIIAASIAGLGIGLFFGRRPPVAACGTQCGDGNVCACTERREAAP